MAILCGFYCPGSFRHNSEIALKCLIFLCLIKQPEIFLKSLKCSLRGTPDKTNLVISPNAPHDLDEITLKYMKTFSFGNGAPTPRRPLCADCKTLFN